jgi:ribosome-binding ATPase YchF (GTP1/OBG family)
VNDHEAIDAINKILDAMFRGDLSHTDAILKVARISGMTKIEHNEVKEQK